MAPSATTKLNSTDEVGDSASNGIYHGDDDVYTVTEAPLGTSQKLRVVTIGAGASGLNMARHIELHLENVEHVIYEKNPEVGGTWFENRYPGCACDIPSHNYQFTWAPNPEWSHFYSTSQEILKYFKGIAHKYELYKYIKLQRRVVGAAWSEEEGMWHLKIENLVTKEILDDKCHFLINGSGILNNWKWPDIEGLDTFKGILLHSASWDPETDVTNKTVAVLGCGSSGVQIVSKIHSKVKELVTFIRTPTWITAGFAQSHAGPNGENFEYSEEQKQIFRNDPEKYIRYRKDIEAELNNRFKFIMKDSREQAEAKQFSTNEMKTKLKNDPRLVKHMIPDFAVGCRRPTPGNGYLEALVQPNVRVITDTIERIVPEGIEISTGEVVKVDVFICATGFDISFCPRFELIGQHGASLQSQWKTKPEAYLSLAAENFPNYFMFLGPNAPVGHGSVLPIIEQTSKYIIRVLRKVQTQGIKYLVPSRAAVADFNKHIPVFLERTAWATHCRSWFKNGKIDGPIVALHPGSRIHWFHMLEDIRGEDYNYAYWTGNRFQYLGNGFSTKEAEGQDTTWYFDEPEKGYY